VAGVRVLQCRTNIEVISNRTTLSAMKAKR